MAEALRANIGSKSAISLQQGPVYPKFQVEGVAPINHSPSQKTRLNDLSYGIKNLYNFFPFSRSQCTRLTDRQTDGHKDIILISRPRLHPIQRGKSWLSVCDDKNVFKAQCRYLEQSPCRQCYPKLENLETPLGIILGKSLKGTSYDIKKHIIKN